MYATSSAVKLIPPPTHQSSTMPSFVQFAPSRRRFVQSASRQLLSSPAHEKHPSSRTLSSRLTKSIPVYDPHLNLPLLAFHGFHSAPISDDR